MLYLRRLSKPSTISKLNSCDRAEDLPADLLGSEFRTAQNTLSLWHFDSDSLDMAISAALLSATEIKKSSFLVFSDSALRDFGLEILDSPGKTGLKYASGMHSDIVELTLAGVKSFLELSMSVSRCADNVITKSRKEIVNLIEELLASNQIEVELLEDRLKREIVREFRNIDAGHLLQGWE